jgi:DNA topoisomerase-1
MIVFGKALPKIRRRVNRDLKLRGLPREKVLATVVQLLGRTFIRVGNEEYAKENKSFGLTTMRNRHVDVTATKLKFSFRGKSGKEHEVDVTDRRLAKIIRQLQDLPGQEVFQYLNGDGERRKVTSEDVNDYLREITGEEFTAKDFRTWAGTVLAAIALNAQEAFENKTQAKKNIKDAISAVAKILGNTPTICRKCYIHPEIINSYLDGKLALEIKAEVEAKLAGDLSRLEPEEAAVLAMLRAPLEQSAKRH